MADLIFTATNNTNDATIKINPRLWHLVPQRKDHHMLSRLGIILFWHLVLSSVNWWSDCSSPQAMRMTIFCQALMIMLMVGLAGTVTWTHLHTGKTRTSRGDIAMHNIILCSFKDDGPFTKMCIDLNLGGVVMEAKMSTQNQQEIHGRWGVIISRGAINFLPNYGIHTIASAKKYLHHWWEKSNLDAFYKWIVTHVLWSQLLVIF